MNTSFQKGQGILDLSPIGCIFFKIQITDGFLTRLFLSKRPLKTKSRLKIAHLSSSLKKCLLNNSLTNFPLPIFICGTVFERKVWSECMKIPCGTTITYGELAKRISCKSPRAVGQALKRNPLPIIIPCHRVLGKGEKLTGFSCGIEIKRMLIEFERLGAT